MTVAEMALSTLKRTRGIIRGLGLNVHPWPSERHLVVDYPVSTMPRYGWKTPPHSLIMQLLQEQNKEFETILAEIAKRRTLLEGILPDPTDDLVPYWDNGWFPPLDACVLMHFMLKYKPKQYLEIGSGHSTIFANHANEFGQLSTIITSIDPQPRRGIDELCTKLVRARLQDIDLRIFDGLEKGDIVFFDGSHLVFTDSDATVFFLEVLPNLPSGVLVHIHDVFWPLDYPPEWGTRHYSEQYLLGMLLIYSGDKYRTVFASAHVSEAYRQRVEDLTSGHSIWNVYGTSYWLEVL